MVYTVKNYIRNFTEIAAEIVMPRIPGSSHGAFLQIRQPQTPFRTFFSYTELYGETAVYEVTGSSTVILRFCFATFHVYRQHEPAHILNSA